MNKMILIYKATVSAPGGRAYFCADGSLSSNRKDAAVYHDSQFEEVSAAHWLVQPAQKEPVVDRSQHCGFDTSVANVINGSGPKYFQGQENWPQVRVAVGLCQGDEALAEQLRVRLEQFLAQITPEYFQ